MITLKMLHYKILVNKLINLLIERVIELNIIVIVI